MTSPAAPGSPASTVTVSWRWMRHYLGYAIGGGAALLLFLAGLFAVFGLLYWIGTLRRRR